MLKLGWGKSTYAVLNRNTFLLDTRKSFHMKNNFSCSILLDDVKLKFNLLEKPFNVKSLVRDVLGN